jgi:hypothetical protein
LKEVKDMENESKNFKLELYKMAWYMRGSISVDEAFHTSVEDREIISKLIKENLETTKKSGLPFF